MATEEQTSTIAAAERKFSLPSWTPKSLPSEKPDVPGKPSNDQSVAAVSTPTPPGGTLKPSQPAARQAKAVAATIAESSASRPSGLLPVFVAFMALVLAGNVGLTLYMWQPKTATETPVPALPTPNVEEVNQLKAELAKTRQQLSRAQQDIAKLQMEQGALNTHVAGISAKTPPLDYPWLRPENGAANAKPAPPSEAAKAETQGGGK